MDRLHLAVASNPLERYLTRATLRSDAGLHLQPLRPGEIIDASTQIYQSLGVLMLRAIFVPSLLCFAALAFVFDQVLPRFFVTDSPGSISGQLAEVLVLLGVTVAVGAPLFFIGASYSIALVCQMVSDCLSGITPSIMAARKAARSCLGRAVWFSVRQSLWACLGFAAGVVALAASAYLETVLPGNGISALVTVFAIVCLAGGVFLMPVVLGLYGVAMPVCLIEGADAKQSIARTRQLMKKHLNQPAGYETILLLYIVMLFLLVLIYGGFSTVYGLLPLTDWVQSIGFLSRYRTGVESVLGGIPLLLTVWVLIPVWGTTTTILYLERRVRLEGYDIDALAKEVWRADRQSRFEL